MTPSRFSFKRRRRQENEKGDEENLDRQQKRRKKKLKLKTLMWLTKKNGKTQKPDKNQQQTLRRAFSVPCVHEKTPYITELFAHPSKSVERLRFPAVTVVNNNDAIYMDTYEPPTKDDLNNSVEQDKKNEEEKKERNTKESETEESSQKSVEIFKEDSDVVIAPAYIGNGKDLTDHQTKIDIEEESSYSEETLPKMRSRRSLHKLKSFGFISAVIIGLLLITILVLLADKITVLLSCPRFQQNSNTISTTLPDMNAGQEWLNILQTNQPILNDESGIDARPGSTTGNRIGIYSASAGNNKTENLYFHVPIFWRTTQLPFNVFVDSSYHSRGIPFRNVKHEKFIERSWRFFFTAIGFKHFTYSAIPKQWKEFLQWEVRVNATLTDDNIATLRWLGFFERKYRIQKVAFQTCFKRVLCSYFRHWIDIGAHNLYGYFFSFSFTDELYDLVQAHPEIAPKKPTSEYILPGLDICHKDKIFKYALTDMRVVKRFFNAHPELVEEKETIEQDAYDYDQYYDSYLFHHYDLSRHYWKFGDSNIYPSGKFFLYD